MGVNAHVNGMDESQNRRIAAVMKERNLRSIRLERFIDLSDVSGQRDLVNRIRAQGGRAQLVLSPPYHTTKDASCRQDLAAVEKENYDYTVAMVSPMQDIVHVYELLNEVQHRKELVAEVPYNSAHNSTAPYEGKPCHATLAAVMRGMSRAIVDIREASGQPLRIIVGLIGKDFGLLKWLGQQGVVYDIVGYHAYPYLWESTLTTNLRMGPQGQLGELAKFNKPIHLNEFNCGEIYRPDYRNRDGDPATEACLKSFALHMKVLSSQKLANIEEVDVYQIKDEPGWTGSGGAEGRFGLMYDLDHPKVNMALVSAFAGGALSAEERTALTSRLLLTDAEIDAYRAAAAAAQAPLRRGTQ